MARQQLSNPVWIALWARSGVIRDWALVDAEDFERINARSWHLHTMGYATAKDGQGKRLWMHHEVLCTTPEEHQVDHKDGEDSRLDNRKSNLRVSTNLLNGQNRDPAGNKSYAGKPTSSQYRGVCFHKDTKKWLAGFQVKGKYVYLGVFADEHEAGRVASEARARYMPHTIETRRSRISS